MDRATSYASAAAVSSLGSAEERRMETRVALNGPRACGTGMEVGTPVAESRTEEDI